MDEAELARRLAEFQDALAGNPELETTEYLQSHPDASESRHGLEAWRELDRLLGDEGSRPVESLSGYRVIGEIGAGGMGRVFLAADERLGRKVAIKTLSPRLAGDPSITARFLNEARSMARINHPNVARVYSLGNEGEPPHFVMEFVEGVPLNRAAAPLTYTQKAELMRKVALAVQHLHEHGLLHRDLKPGNILVSADLEPKLLDFGLALESGHARLTHPGLAVGTPEYFSPEQARGEADERSDVYSLGAILYELLTGKAPAREPALPRQVAPEAPGELQNICMKAIEAEPSERYASAAEMAADLGRYLAGEPVLAAPASYPRLVARTAEQHLRGIESWRRDGLISQAEHDAFRKSYGRLAEPEDAWIMEARRLSAPQVALYLGAWIAAVGAALVVLFKYASLAGAPSVLLTGAAAAAIVYVGLRQWRAGVRRAGVAFLLAGCLLIPIAILSLLTETGVAAGATRGRDDLELFSRLSSFKRVANAQIWWALMFAVPPCIALRRFTRSAVFSLAAAFFAGLFCAATLLRLGLIEWIESDPGRPYLYLLPCALLFLAAGVLLERAGLHEDSKYVYPFSVVFTYGALSGIAGLHQPYADWLKTVAPWTRGSIEYLFLINACVYFLLQMFCERLDSAQMRAMARAYRFVLPGHVLLPVLLLGMEATGRGEASFESRFFEVLLPVAACGFVIASVPKQMKNFFASGLVFLAVGLIRLQQNLLKDHAVWPVMLLAGGIGVMLLATRYTPVMLALRKLRGKIK